MRRIQTACLVLCFVFVSFVAASFAQQGVIREIVVLGNERVEKEVILKEIKSKAGEPLSQEKVREDIKAIYRLGYFRDVQVDVSEADNKVILTFAVIEKPYVANIIVAGNEKIKLEDIEGAIEVKRDSVLEMGKVRASQKEIKKLYTAKRYFGSEVEYRVELDKGNKAVVYFDIVEGVKGYLTDIAFVGNKVIGSRKLKSAMKTKEKGFFWWMTKAGTLETDVLELDMTRIRALYFDRGYVMAKVNEPQISLAKDKKSMNVTIKIEEGQQYTVGSLDITGDILTAKKDLLKGLNTKAQKVYRSSLVNKDLLWLSDQYADKGYAYVDVSPLTMLDNEKRLVHLNYKIEKGIPVHINRIEIAGNVKTRDRVIRRELKVAEGDLYSSTRIRKSRERVMRTRYFKGVDFVPSPTEKRDLIDLDIRVEEADMGRLAFGAGYSNVKGVLGSIELSHGNLFGRGYFAQIKFELGENTINYRVGFNNPRFLDTPLSLGFDLYRETWEYDWYNTDITGGDIKIGREITENIRADLMYVFEHVRIYDVQVEDLAAIPPIDGYKKGDYIYDEWKRNKPITSKIVLTVSRNTINDPFFPTRGSQISVSGTFAGLGGDNFFYGATASASWFHPVIGDLVVNLRGSAGFVQAYKGIVPLTEKFFVGGISSLRGFEYGMAGPRDFTDDEPIGALNMAVFTTELLYPLSKSLGIRGAVFYDVGSGWGGGESGGVNNDFLPLRHAVGVGIRWYSPFGPIRIDWGYNLTPRRGDKSNVWDFSMGALF